MGKDLKKIPRVFSKEYFQEVDRCCTILAPAIKSNTISRDHMRTFADFYVSSNYNNSIIDLIILKHMPTDVNLGVDASKVARKNFELYIGEVLGSMYISPEHKHFNLEFEAIRDNVLEFLEGNEAQHAHFSDVFKSYEVTFDSLNRVKASNRIIPPPDLDM